MRAMKSSAAFGSAFLAGVLGALAMTVLMSLCRALNLTALNLEILLGSLIASRVGPGVWLLGFVTHLVVGGFFGLLYGIAFQVTGRSGPGTGTLFGFAHWLVAGSFLMVFPAIHPLIPEVLRAPGPFALALGGSAFVLTLLEHLMYGAIVGGVYEQSTRASEIESGEVAEFEKREEQRKKRAA